ncbi:MAG: MATE family efflux transporter [Opitutaceae bacterium]
MKLLWKHTEEKLKDHLGHYVYPIDLDGDGIDEVVVSALVLAGRAQMFQITLCVALASGAQILMAHWMGARRFADVNRQYWVAIRAGMIVAGGYALTLWLFSEQVFALFTDDPAVKQLGGALLLVAVFLEPARAVNIIGGYALRTVGDSRFPLIIAVIFIWGILPVILLIESAWGIGLISLWICFAADEIIRAVINLWRWRTGRWKAMGLAEMSADVSSSKENETGRASL